MKLFIFLVLYALLIIRPLPVGAFDGKLVQRDLEATARTLQRKEAERNRQREFDKRVQSEAQRLGVASDPRRVSIVRLILANFGADAHVALAVAKAEGGLRPGAVGDGGNSVCAFQINQAHFGRWSRESLFNPETCVQAAYQIFKESYWYPWTVYRTGAYLAYL